jgi:hypothetical protein
MDKLPPAIYHWQMGTTASLYGLDKEVLLESGLIPQPPSPLSVADIDISEDFDDFNVLEAIHYEKNGL